MDDNVSRNLRPQEMFKLTSTAKKYLDFAGVIVVILDADGRVRHLNQKGCEVLGYTEKETIGSDWFDRFIPAGRRDRLKAVFRRLVDGDEGTVKYYENPVLTKGGELRIIAWHNRRLHDHKGKFAGTLSSGEDVTAYRRAERHLAAQYGVARSLIESPNLRAALPRLLEIVCQAEDWKLGELWWVDRENEVLRRKASWHLPESETELFVSESAGLTFARGVGLPGIVWETAKPRMIADLTSSPHFVRGKPAAEVGLHAAFALPILRAGQVAGVMAFYSSEVHSRDQDALSMLEGVSRQIEQFNKKRRTEEALQRSEARLRTILDTVADAVITINERGVIESFNPAAERIFGYRASEITGKPVKMLMPSPDRERHDEYIGRYLRTGEARIIGIGREVIAQRKDGSTFPIYLSIGDMQLGNRRMFTGVIRDFTEFRRMQDEILQARNLAAIGELAASVAHEIKNPIAGIGGALEVIYEQMAPDAPHRGVLEEVLKQIQRLDNTVRQLLMFARPWHVEKQRCNLREVVGQIVEPLKAQENYSGITFAYQGGDALEARVDLSLFENLLLNLLQNAADAMPDGGTIQLGFSATPDGIEFTVADDGTGVSPDHMEHLFRPFFTTKTRGTGLGLAICKKVMEAHRGSIRISSEPARGTVVSLKFPKN